jgi:asparagine synthase (glutamine-hydrolysing)
MPGITGIIRKHPYDGIEEDLKAMIDVMCHEKFYRSGQYINKDVGVYVGWTCHQHSFADCMPLVSEGKDSILIFQGENYVDQETLSALPHLGDGIDGSSARYLLKMYEEMGSDFLRQLNGWFCGILVDLRDRKVTLFNDRYGMSRVYIHEEHDAFLFSSEAKSLLRIRPSLRLIRPDAVAQYLRYNCVIGGQTLFKDISLLPNGSSWVFGGGVLRKKQRYFDPTDWERQPTLPLEEFYEKFAETVTKVIPRYIKGPQKAALALTGGLDTRLIETVLRPTNRLRSCYTFGGPWGDSFDIIKARQIAAMCGQFHETIKLDETFFDDFPDLARRSVYLSDGTHDAFGAHDVYLNPLARQIAPVRLTGKFGSEVVKTRRLIPWLSYSADFVQPDLKPFLDELQPRDRFRQKYSLSTLLFEEIPWYEWGRVAVEQSQLTLRTPYLDNDLVKLMYQAESGVRAAGELQPRVIREKSPDLNAVLTNMGGLGNGGPLLTKIRYIFYRALFKMEYYYLFATPHWLTRIDRKLEKLRLEKILAGREKYEGYRIWIKSHLVDFITQTLSNPNAHYVQFFDRSAVQQMVARHRAGTHNYLNEINKVLTIELACASLIDQQTRRDHSRIDQPQWAESRRVVA